MARAFPLYTAKTQKGKPLSSEGRDVSISFLDDKGAPVEDSAALLAAEVVSEGVRLAARLVDTPPENMKPSDFAEECKKVASALPL